MRDGLDQGRLSFKMVAWCLLGMAVSPNRLIKAQEEFNTDKADPVDEEDDHVFIEPEVKSNQQVPTTNTISDKLNIVMQDTLGEKIV